VPGWRAAPVVQVSQVGYHPAQSKVAVIELDARDDAGGPATLLRVDLPEGPTPVLAAPATPWGAFLRYRYARFDFSAVTTPGLYVVRYGAAESSPFAINPAIYQRGVWQPTVETFLPVQMCHMRVEDRYRVWHGLCHADDALMAPVNLNHFDGYAQGPTTLTSFKSGDHVPGLDRGGWHDAGDYDLRVESQADTVHGLALAWQLFHPAYDNTTVDETSRVVQLFRPDGRPDVLQQVEHGVLTILGGYRALGRTYRGIQDATLRQYTHLGDAATMTDNLVFHDDAAGTALRTIAAAAVHGVQADPAVPGIPRLGLAGAADDRWVFTEENPDRELNTAAALAAASVALLGYNDDLAAECRRTAGALWDHAGAPRNPLGRLGPAVDLLQATGERKYTDAILALGDLAAARLATPGSPEKVSSILGMWAAARSLALVPDAAYQAKIRGALRAYRTRLDGLAKETPYGVPYQPDIWGAGWTLQRFGVEQYFLHVAAPDLFPADAMLSSLNFILGCHPGANPASFVSGVGARSVTTAYGINRADASFIPGGIVSGTALIRPDFPELLDWPYLWQQTEYCLGRPTSDYVFLVLAADNLLNHP
jgi:endoglucanase